MHYDIRLLLIYWKQVLIYELCKDYLDTEAVKQRKFILMLVNRAISG